MCLVETLYQRLGGMEAVARLVFDLYERVQGSRRLAPYFADADMATLIDHQTQFLASLAGGPQSYSDAHLSQKHAKLAIDDHDFDEMLELMSQALRAGGIAGEDHDAFLAALDAHRPLIVSQAPTKT